MSIIFPFEPEQKSAIDAHIVPIHVGDLAPYGQRTFATLLTVAGLSVH